MYISVQLREQREPTKYAKQGKSWGVESQRKFSQLCANSGARNHEALCIELHKGKGFKNILRNAGLKHQVCVLVEMTC